MAPTIKKRLFGTPEGPLRLFAIAKVLLPRKRMMHIEREITRIQKEEKGIWNEKRKKLFREIFC